MQDPSSYKWAEFIEVAERLRQQRQSEWRLQRHRNAVLPTKQDGIYSQRDMWNHVSGYKALLEHRRQQMPSREMIEHIVEYLECSLAEQNTLRVAAGLAPLYLDPQGEEFQGHISALRMTLRMLPFPAYIVSRDWFIYAVNHHLLKFLNLTEQAAQNIPEPLCNVLHFIFNPDLQVRQRLTGGKGGWRAIAERNIYGFKLNNSQTLHDFRVVQLLASLRDIPNGGFQSVWDEVQAKPYTQSPFYDADYVTEMQAPNDPSSILAFRSLHVHYGDIAFPGIIAYVPTDRETEKVFQQLGLPTFSSEADVLTQVGYATSRSRA
jgi:hypothetical protein